MVGRCNGCQRIELVVHACQAPLHARYRSTLVQHVKSLRVAHGRKIAHCGAEAAHRAPAAGVQHTGQAFFQPVDHHATRGRHGAHQVVELALDGGQVVKDVGVVELQIVQHRRARAVMHELAALVEKGGVVFVGLNDKQRAGVERPFACDGALRGAQAGRHPEVQRHAANQKARLQSGTFQNPGQHRRGGGLAVGARHSQHMAALQHMLGQPLRAAGVGQAGVQNGFHQRKLGAAVGQPGAADHIAHHEHIGAQRQLVGAEAFDQLDAQGAQLIAHGWVNTGVAASNLVPCFPRQRGQAPHERAADPEYVYVHGRRF
jgi:hypothetical protein